MPRFENRVRDLVVVVTGAGSGIGAATRILYLSSEAAAIITGVELLIDAGYFL